MMAIVFEIEADIILSATYIKWKLSLSTDLRWKTKQNGSKDIAINIIWMIYK